MHIIAQKLIRWYGENQRDLPWRRTTDPYKIWVSEIILQQTRVEQGRAYYLRFLNAFPDVNALAKADQQQVLKTWQGLGYYSRARNMHQAAKTIATKFNGVFPDNYQDILSLKGIGEYTAGAVASFAYNLPYPAVDGNVLRVLARLFDVHEKINTASGVKKIKKITESLLPKEDPATFNQSLIEFGALWCTPKKPACLSCPLQQHCLAFTHNTVESLPAKKPKKKPQDRYLNYLVIKDEDQRTLYLRKRIDSRDIWENLYDFPLIESKKPISPEELVNTSEWKILIGHNYRFLSKNPRKKKHQLSHQTLHALFWEVQIDDSFDLSDKKMIISDYTENLYRYPFPKLIDGYLKENIIEYKKNTK